MNWKQNLFASLALLSSVASAELYVNGFIVVPGNGTSSSTSTNTSVWRLNGLSNEVTIVAGTNMLVNAIGNTIYVHQASSGIFDGSTNVLGLHTTKTNFNANEYVTDEEVDRKLSSLSSFVLYNTNTAAGVVNNIGSGVWGVGTNDIDAIAHNGTALANINMAGVYSITNIPSITFTATAYTNYTSIYATRTNLVLVPPSVATSLQMQVERRDTLNEYDMTNGFFYPKNAGRYRVDYQHIWPIIPNGFPYTEQITVDGVPYVNRLSVYDASAPNYSDTISFGATVACTDTSVVKVFIAQYNATGVSNGQANVNGGYIFINIERMLP